MTPNPLTTDELVEIVARAIFDESAFAATVSGTLDQAAWTTLEPDEKEFAVSIALAAIRAIESVGGKVLFRNATPEMISAASEALTNWRKTLTRDEAMSRMYFAPDRKFKASATPEEKHAIRFAAMFDVAPLHGGK